MISIFRHGCTARPGAPNRWTAAGAVVLALALGAVPVRGQVAVGQASTCPGGAPRVGDLGLDFTCHDCSLSYDADSQRWRWRFRSEPIIDHVSSSGPSRGRLQNGDVLVRVDGSLITTRSAGAKLASLAPDVPVAVTVRRQGREVTTEVTPTAACQASGVPPAPPSPAAMPSPPEPGRAPRSARGVGRAVPAPDPLPPTLLGSRAWFGFGLSCSNCKIFPLRQEEIADAEARLKNLAEEGNDPRALQRLYAQLESYRQEGSQWEFSENPRIFSVDDGGPADRAGLRRGDVLTHIDGVALLSDEGGRRLGQVRPGDEVEFVYQRGTAVGTARLTAGSVPSRQGLASELALRRSQALLERTLRDMERSDPDPEQAVELARIQSQLEEAQSIQRIAAIESLRSRRGGTMPLRYSGSIARVNLTVRSHGSVVVTRDEESGEVVITTSDATIRVKPED